MERRPRRLLARDGTDEHGDQRMQIEGEAEGKGAPAHIVDGERLGEARDVVKPSEPTMNGGGRR